MSEPIRYFFPGPTYVRQATRQAMTAPSLPHRSADFKPVYARATGGLKNIFRTKRDVFIVSGSSTLGMEIGVLSTVRRKVLNLVCGAFSERWHGISRALGLDATSVEVPWGEPIDPDEVRRAVQRDRYEAVTVVHCETSTGVLNPLAEITRAVRENSDALILVDAVSSLAGAAVETDEWGLDFVVTGSQKALALPPGLAFITASQRALLRAERVRHRGFYTDLLRYRDQHKKGGPITTPAEAQISALDHQLQQIAEEGLENRWQRHLDLQQQVQTWAQSHEITYVSTPASRSPTVSCLLSPKGVDPATLITALADRGFTIASGYGQFKGATFRIGHMGEVQAGDVTALFNAFDDILDDLSPRHQTKAG